MTPTTPGLQLQASAVSIIYSFQPGRLTVDSNGSYYYSNSDGSKYYNNGAGGASYTAPDGAKYSSASGGGNSQSSQSQK